MAALDYQYITVKLTTGLSMQMRIWRPINPLQSLVLSDFAIQLISESFFQICSGKGSVEFGLSLIDFV